MRGIVFHGFRDVRIENVPEPKAGKNELLLKPLAAGICLTDRHAYGSEVTSYKPGIIIGHEGAGEIVAIGDGVEGWSVGEHVAVDPEIHCGRCIPCLMGQWINCTYRAKNKLGSGIGVRAIHEDGNPYHGFMADLCVVPSQNCYRLPKNIDFISASNIEPMAQALNTVRHSGVLPGDNVVLMGLEDYNALVIQLLQLNSIVAVDPILNRRKMATELGAGLVLDPTRVNIVEEVRKLFPFGADIAFISHEDYIPASLLYPSHASQFVRIGGSIMLTRFQLKGNIGDADSVPYSFVKGLTIKMPGLFSEDISRGGIQRSDYQIVIDYLANGKLNAKCHVSKVIRFEDLATKADIDDIFAMMPEKETKIVISMG